MKQVEVHLRDGMARQGIAGDAAEQIITSITSFALYGFPESHAASFALLAYASAYLKAHFPAAFYTALLNNQPMGFYHPSTLVKGAQRRGVRFHPIDVQVSDWDCTVEPDGAIRLGLRYVSGLRQDVGRRIAAVSRPADPAASAHPASPTPAAPAAPVCPKCGCDDRSMLEPVKGAIWFCNNCSHDWPVRLADPAGIDGRARSRQALRKFASLDDFVARSGARRDELVTLADIGALNAFGYDRRSALWQAERAIRPSGELFREEEEGTAETAVSDRDEDPEILASPQHPDASPCPLKPMTEAERLVADYAGMGLTAGRHPM